VNDLGELVTYTDPHGRRRQCPTAWGSTCKARYCPRCGTPWGRDQRTRLSGNLAAKVLEQADYGRTVTMISITPPGADVLPCSAATCGDKGEHEQRGKRGCRIDPEASRRWHESLPYRWSRLRDACRRRLKRAGLDCPTLAQVWEMQTRGAAHAHLVVPFATDEEKHAAQLLARALDELGPRWGFGFVDEGARNEAGDRELVEWKGHDAAFYLAGYLIGGNNGRKPALREAVRNAAAGGYFPKLPTTLVWVRPALTRITGLTMRNLRRVRHVLAAAKGLCPAPRWRDQAEYLAIRQLVRRIFGERAPPVRATPTLADHLLAAEFPREWVAEPMRVVSLQPVQRAPAPALGLAVAA
jgi:hypothetical protein